ncbi:hypothetical protein Z052_12400 [Halorubrum sp. C191]|nr:hypothetical protein Z052_12400 [Halorubrum sp. C191]
MDKYSATSDRLPRSGTTLVDMFGDADSELCELPVPLDLRDRRLEMARECRSAYGYGHARRRVRQSTRRADSGPTEGTRRGERPLLAHVFETSIDTVVDELAGVACI